MIESNNDLIVLDCSLLVQDYLQGEFQNVSFVVNDQAYDTYYLLIDGIYPKWKIFVQFISEPLNEKVAWFAKNKEGTKKDSKRAFLIRQPNMF